MQRFPAQWGLSATTSASSDGAGAGAVRGAVPCQLVRGVQSVQSADGNRAQAENHMWNVVRLGNDLFVVDVMQRPGQLFAADSKEAKVYQRAILADAGSSIVQSKVSCDSFSLLLLVSPPGC